MPTNNDHLALPKQLYFETTNRCNLRCKGCIRYRGNWEKERDPTLADLAMITEQLPNLEKAFLHGIGEPLLNKELPQMIQHLKMRKVFVGFNSNAILLDKKLQNQLIDAGLDELRISLDAASPKGYRAIRDSDSFDQIVQNLKSFVKLQNNSRATAPTLSLWFLATQGNIRELPDFVRLAAAIGVKEIYLQRLVYFQDHPGYGIANRKSALWNATDGMLALIQKSQALADQMGVQFNASGLCKPADSLQATADHMPWRNCYRPSTLIYITSNGNVLPCCISPFSTTDYASIILGNVFKTSIQKIWTGTDYTFFRKKHQTKSPPKCCQGCGVLWSL